MFLLAGILLMSETGSAEFRNFDINSLYGQLIFMLNKSSFSIIKWLVTGFYPEASEIGTVALSTFTTKLAIFCFAKFSGTEVLL